MKRRFLRFLDAPAERGGSASEEKSIKVEPVLYRQGTSELKEDGSIRLSISSDKPYLRYDWWNDEEFYEKLDHSPAGIDLERIRAGTALLFNHDRDVQLGTITSPELDNGKCFVAARISDADDVASHRTRIKEGILKDSSVGYELIDEGTQEGELNGIPVYRFKWRPFEASLVTIPADITVGVGRERHLEKPKAEPREIRIRSKKLEKEFDGGIETQHKASHSRSTTTHTMTPEEQKAADEKAKREREESERQRKEQVAEGMKAVREREKEIRAIAKRAKNLPESVLEKALDDAVTNERAAEDFRKLVFEKYFGDPQPVETPNGESDIEVVGERKGRGLSVGAEFVNSRDFKERAGKRQIRRSVSVEFPDVTMLGIRGKMALARRAASQQRAGFTSTDLAPVNIQIQNQVVGLGMQRLTIMDLLTGGNTGAAAILYPKENSFGTVDGVAVAAGQMPRAKTVGERQRKPLWDPDLTTDTANVKKVAITTKVPDEFVADFPAVQSYIDGRLPFMVDTETEFQLLYGDGLNNNLKGIFSTAGIQTRAIDATNDRTVADSLKKGLTDIEVNSFFEPDGYAMHPYDFETASLLKDTQGRYLMGGPFYLPIGEGLYVELHTFWGKPVVKTTAVNYGRPVAGCFKLGAQYFMREGMRLEMTNANEDDFVRNLIAIRAEHRLALATYRPISFIEFTGFPPRT